MARLNRITPCLWYDDQAEAAAAHYTAIFDNSRIVAVARYGEAGFDHHGKAPGTVMTVAFELDGQSFTALNGGPHFRFNEALSLQVNCEDQDEVDHYWHRLGEGGDERAQQCGWLKDRFGLSWQVVPTMLPRLLLHPDTVRSQRVFAAILQMKKPDIAALERAWGGELPPEPAE